jgi:S-phase kinase-associated protein 1
VITDLGDETGNLTTPIPIPNVKADILKKVLSWCAWHVDDPAAINAETEKEDPRSTLKAICEWDARCFQVDQETLYELILAANYMNIKLLLDNLCKYVASMIHNKTPDQIRKIYNLERDFTPEQEEEIRREIQWADGH